MFILSSRKFFLSLLVLTSLITFPLKSQAIVNRYLGEAREDLVSMGEMIRTCVNPIPENPEYQATLAQVSYKGKLQPGEEFMITIHLLNTGNVTWFGDKNFCNYDQIFRLGASGPQDRISQIWHSLVKGEVENHGWLSPSRIMMKQPMVQPGQLGTFEFKAIAPQEEDIYIEYFSPLIEGVTWFEELKIPVRFHVGNVTDEQRDKTFFMTFSGRADDIDLTQRNILVDISEQKAYLRLGERDIFIFTISSGAPDTPTPITKTKIYSKQWVRIGSTAPYYVMPRYHALRENGAYGFHALPSLRNDKGVFWQEAFDHIGRRVSHGCIRMLPQDADTLWNFAEVGTPVEITW